MSGYVFWHYLLCRKSRERACAYCLSFMRFFVIAIDTDIIMMDGQAPHYPTKSIMSLHWITFWWAQVIVFVDSIYNYYFSPRIILLVSSTNKGCIKCTLIDKTLLCNIVSQSHKRSFHVLGPYVQPPGIPMAGPLDLQHKGHFNK